MVSSIVPGTAGANALGVDTRYTRATTPGVQQRNDAQAGDRVEMSGAAAWNAARESVAAALTQLQQGLDGGRDAQTMLLTVQSLLSSGGSQSDLDSLLQGYNDSIGSAIAGGAGLLAGAALSVQAEPGGAPLTIAGADLRLKATPGEGSVISVASNAAIDDPALGQNVSRSLDQLQSVMERLGDAARSLQAHQGFLGAVNAAPAANADLDADGARLLALQVRQALQAIGGGAIANAEPQAVLSLFKV